MYAHVITIIKEFKISVIFPLHIKSKSSKFKIVFFFKFTILFGYCSLIPMFQNKIKNK